MHWLIGSKITTVNAGTELSTQLWLSTTTFAQCYFEDSNDESTAHLKEETPPNPSLAVDPKPNKCTL